MNFDLKKNLCFYCETFHKKYFQFKKKEIFGYELKKFKLFLKFEENSTIFQNINENKI